MPTGDVTRTGENGIGQMSTTKKWNNNKTDAEIRHNNVVPNECITSLWLYCHGRYIYLVDLSISLNQVSSMLIFIISTASYGILNGTAHLVFACVLCVMRNYDIYCMFNSYGKQENG